MLYASYCQATLYPTRFGSIRFDSPDSPFLLLCFKLLTTISIPSCTRHHFNLLSTHTTMSIRTSSFVRFCVSLASVRFGSLRIGLHRFRSFLFGFMRFALLYIRLISFDLVPIASIRFGSVRFGSIHLVRTGSIRSAKRFGSKSGPERTLFVAYTQCTLTALVVVRSESKPVFHSHSSLAQTPTQQRRLSIAIRVASRR